MIAMQSGTPVRLKADATIPLFEIFRFGHTSLSLVEVSTETIPAGTAGEVQRYGEDEWKLSARNPAHYTKVLFETRTAYLPDAVAESCLISNR